MRSVVLLTMAVLALMTTGCPDNSGGSVAVGPTGPAPVFLNITCDPQADPQAMDMALKLAGFSLDEGRSVFLFFNVKGVKFPLKEFPADFAFGEDALLPQLSGLIERGATVHVCPICMKALGIEASQVMDGAEVTTRAGLFERIGPETAVFSY